MRPIVQSRKLQHVRYDVRGPILVEAQRLEAEGHKILKLNIGNPAPFGFEAPEAIVADMVHNLPDAQGYSDSRGIYSARTAVAQYYQSRGLTETAVDDVFIGNGVSELITMVLQAFLDDGNEVLVPAPDYPLWTGAVVAGRRHPGALPLRRGERLEPRPRGHRVEDHREHPRRSSSSTRTTRPARSTPRTTVKALVDIARRHELVIFTDEIYEKILFDDAVHHHTAAFAGDDVLCLTFSGLSKAYRVCGYRAGWVMISGPQAPGRGLPRGPDPAGQHADVPQRPGPARDPDRARRLPVDQRVHRARRPLLRAEQDSPGSCSTRSTASPASSRTARSTASRSSTPRCSASSDDEKFVIDLLRAKKILVTHGTGFNWFEPDHFRLVTLPDVRC